MPFLGKTALDPVPSSVLKCRDARQMPLLNLPASAEQVSDVENALSIAISADLRAVWERSNVMVFPDSGVTLYGTDDIVERNATFEIREYAPGLLLFGDDGGGRGFFVGVDADDVGVVAIDLGAVGSSEGSRIADGVFSWVEQGCPIPAGA